MTKKKAILWIRLIRPMLHSIIIALLYFIAYHLRQHTDGIPGLHLRIPNINNNELLLYAIVSIVVFLVIWIIKRNYELTGTSYGSNKTFLSVRSQRTITMTCIWYFWQGFLFQEWISRLILIWIVSSTLVVIPLIDNIRKRIYLERMKQYSHSLLILYRDNAQAKDIIDQIKLPSYYGIHKKEFFWPISWTIQQDIVLLVGSYNQDELQEIIDNIRLQSKELYHISDNHFLEDVIYIPKKIWWLRSVQYTSSIIEWRSAITKRAFDIIWSIVGLIILWPIMIITAIAIKITTVWPVFYVQERVWKNEKKFLFVKFRSMYTHMSIWEKFWWKDAEDFYKKLVNSNANIRKWELPKIKNDPRVTPLGRILRATSIDELPNLFSVIRWDMSLIWPRPHLPSEIENYKPRQRRVLSIKPWITWYAQIHGRDTLSFDEEATKELEYIQNRSLWLDFYILFATVGVIFGGRGK